MVYVRCKTRAEIGNVIRLFNLPEPLLSELRRAFTFVNPALELAKKYSPWGSEHIDPEFRMWHTMLRENGEEYDEIPRGFSANKLSTTALAQWLRLPKQDYRTSYSVKFPKRLLTPNPDQLKIEKAFKKAEANKARPAGTYLIVAPTSAGKTISQACLAGITGQRTLVLAQTNLIKRAWTEDLYKLYGMNENDLGIIQQNKYRLGRHITIASIKTLERRKHLWHEIFSKVGCLIIDECQLIGAERLAEIVEACPAKYVIGMTATPTRRDGKSFIVYSSLGNPLITIENKQEETATSLPLADAEVVNTEFKFENEKGEQIDGEELDFNKLTDAMINDRARNELCVKRIAQDWKAGHSVLVTTPRVDHIATLVKMLHKAGVEDANGLTGEQNASKTYANKLLDLLMSRTCRCLVATTQLIKLGANINPLGRLHAVIPPMNESDLEQLIGRIRRKSPKKKDAKMVWYLDQHVPYLFRKYKRVFFPVMRKLKVKRYENIFVC